MNELVFTKCWISKYKLSNSVTWLLCSKVLSLKAKLSTLCLEVLSKIQYPSEYKEVKSQKKTKPNAKTDIYWNLSKGLRKQLKEAPMDKVGTIGAINILSIGCNAFVTSKFIFKMLMPNVPCFQLVHLEHN